MANEASPMTDQETTGTDEEIKDLMRAIAKANGRPLTDERIEVDLPACKGFLQAIRRLDAYKFALEDEPAFHFSLHPQTRGPKGGSQ